MLSRGTCTCVLYLCVHTCRHRQTGTQIHTERKKYLIVLKTNFKCMHIACISFLSNMCVYYRTKSHVHQEDNSGSLSTRRLSLKPRCHQESLVIMCPLKDLNSQNDQIVSFLSSFCFSFLKLLNTCMVSSGCSR